MKIDLLTKEAIKRINWFLKPASLSVGGASITDSGTLNIGLNRDDVTTAQATELADFCNRELGLDVQRVNVNCKHVIDLH